MLLILEVNMLNKDKKTKKRVTARLNTISEMFDIPLNTLRIWASQNKFPGIIRRGRSVYVKVDKFRDWWLTETTEGGS